jgi:hypothetical protein
VKAFLIIGFSWALLASVGCAPSAQPAAVEMRAIPPDELVPTLEEIARTGEYSNVWNELTAGLEQSGHMSEAAAVQNFQYADSPQKVKAMATEIIRRLQPPNTESPPS